MQRNPAPVTKAILLSSDSVARCIWEMSMDTEQHLCATLRGCPFSIQLDETIMAYNNVLLIIPDNVLLIIYLLSGLHLLLDTGQSISSLFAEGQEDRRCWRDWGRDKQSRVNCGTCYSRIIINTFLPKHSDALDKLMIDAACLHSLLSSPCGSSCSNQMTVEDELISLCFCGNFQTLNTCHSQCFAQSVICCYAGTLGVFDIIPCGALFRPSLAPEYSRAGDDTDRQSSALENEREKQREVEGERERVGQSSVVKEKNEEEREGGEMKEKIKGTYNSRDDTLKEKEEFKGQVAGLCEVSSNYSRSLRANKVLRGQKSRLSVMLRGKSRGFHFYLYCKRLPKKHKMSTKRQSAVARAASRLHPQCFQLKVTTE
ncbi:hypothetical protein INR49_000411 [Caranx melampygus]|nr:hypothetical protein INR49_000411 [Caranx melampygus]